MKLCLISDLHGFLPETPECDVLVIAGDVCPAINHTIEFQRLWLNSNFKHWIWSQQAKKVVMTPGNHDWIFQKNRKLVPYLPWHVLIDESVDIFGVRFYGTPWQPEFNDWAFNSGPNRLQFTHDKIPPCDVLICHGPPYGHCDTVAPFSEHLGAPSLTQAIERVKPQLLVCGHIHGGYGQSTIGETVVVNSSITTEQYVPSNAPVMFELEPNPER